MNIPNQPLHSLKAFKRIHLKAGETRPVILDLRPDTFAYINEKGEKVFNSGKFEVYVGGGQPGISIGLMSTVNIKAK